MNKDEWTKEFERYKKFPEWQQRQSMTLNEFKFIYFWEYGHRMFGRFLGVAFAVPFSYFAVRFLQLLYFYRICCNDVYNSYGSSSSHIILYHI